MTMKHAGERGRFAGQVIRVRETIKDAFTRLMDGPGMGFGPELAFVGAGGRSARASEFERFQNRPPKNSNVLFDLTDSGPWPDDRCMGDSPGGVVITVGHYGLKSSVPLGRAMTAISLTSGHPAYEVGSIQERSTSLLSALLGETNPNAATVILVCYAFLAKEARAYAFGQAQKIENAAMSIPEVAPLVKDGRISLPTESQLRDDGQIRENIVKTISSLELEGFKLRFSESRLDWERKNPGTFDEAVEAFSSILQRLKGMQNLDIDVLEIQKSANTVYGQMFEMERRINPEGRGLPGLAFFQFTVTRDMQETGGVPGCDPVVCAIPDTTEHGNLLDLKSEWGYIRAKAAVRAMETLEGAINGLIDSVRKEERRGPLATIRAKGEFDAKASAFEEAARAILDALRKEKDPLVAEIMLRAYVYHAHKQGEREELLRTLNNLNLSFGPRDDHFAGTRAAIDGYNRVLDQITTTLEHNQGDRLIRGFRAGLLQDARKALLALEKLHEVELQATRGLGQESCGGI